MRKILIIFLIIGLLVITGCSEMKRMKQLEMCTTNIAKLVCQNHNMTYSSEYYYGGNNVVCIKDYEPFSYKFMNEVCRVKSKG